MRLPNQIDNFLNSLNIDKKKPPSPFASDAPTLPEAPQPEYDSDQNPNIETNLAGEFLWLTPQEFDKKREQFVKINHQAAKKLISHLLKEAETRLKGEDIYYDSQELATMLCHYWFGVHLAFWRMNAKPQPDDFIYYNSRFPTIDYMVSYSPKEFYPNQRGRLKVNIAAYLHIYLNKDEQPRKRMLLANGLPEESSPFDDSLISGLEEGAHFLYEQYRELPTEENLDYHASDIEYTAMLWKYSFIKRYFPNYLSSFKERLKTAQTEWRVRKGKRK